MSKNTHTTAERQDGSPLYTIEMSTLQDNTISNAEKREFDSASPREEDENALPSSSSGEDTSEGSNMGSQDSGMVLNFSSSFRNSLKNSKPGSAGVSVAEGGGTILNLNLRRPSAGLAPPGSVPLCDLRRPSIVDMVNSGGLFITQSGACEINFDNVDPIDVEQLYADVHQGQHRRGSCSASAQGYLDKKELKGSLDDDNSLGQLQQPDKSNDCLNTSRFWWSAKFKSEVLEKQLKKTVIEFLRRRFRVALVFIAMFTLLWIVLFSVNIPFSPSLSNSTSVHFSNNELAITSVRYSPAYVLGGLTLFILLGVLLFLTCTRFYARFALALSVLLSVILMCVSFSLALALVFDEENIHGFLTISFVAQFAITAVFILVIFTLSRLPLWLSVLLTVIYLIILECTMGVAAHGIKRETLPGSRHIYINSSIGRIMLYVGLVLAGVTTAYLLKFRQKATFWKIAQCVLSQKALDLERELEEKTILSMMPKHFADGLLDVQVQMAFMIKQRAVQESEGTLDPAYQSIYAPFNICSMDNVSILFADIVDFTQFSSTLSAAELVGILNTVFCMFDDFVDKHRCEKISTLGDCYFCVSGCPEAEPEHAENCVNMGLAIIAALEDYRKRTQWPIGMRVGIHTGSVFCGVMGTKRFKFDVWSRDVSIANLIESVSAPGCVLISSATQSCISDSASFITEQANIQKTDPRLTDMELYYVMDQRALSSSNNASSSGLSGAEWKKKINTIDTICKTEEASTATSAVPAARKTSVSSIRSNREVLFPCFPRKKAPRPSVRRTLGDSHSSTSIMDIQTQLHRCTSYAELSVPHQGGEEETQENTDMDEDIVKYMEEHKVYFDTYFDPQLHLITLHFHDREWEKTYRNYGRDLDDGSNGELTEMELGYRITKLSYMLDTVALFVNFILIMIGSAVCLSSNNAFDKGYPAWLGVFIIGLVVEIFVMVLVFAVFAPHKFPKFFAKFATFIINWYARAVVALFFIYYPIAVIGVGFALCQNSNTIESQLARQAHVQMTFLVTLVVLVSSITFMEVGHIVKFIGGFLVAVLAIGVVIALGLSVCDPDGITQNSTLLPITPIDPVIERPSFPGVTRPFATDSPISTYFTTYYTRHVAPEAIILLLLVLILLAVINRMSEVSVRLSFIGRIEASARRRFTRQLKVQAEWLLFNIIPPHVAYKLRTTGKFSQNHECVGVMFASIVNFRQFLHNDEKGEDSLRLLNVIISEFDTLLERQCFSGSVEKIKTIGSTYMAASGLNLPPEEECNSVKHLLDLIEFGHQLVETLEVMNRKFTDDFVFEMHIGFNYGPVTSGVVGSRKMLYDMWGDTVNVASRMDSTGAIKKIHMPQRCLEKLGPYVTHTIHKVINVKGKGAMRTVFVTRPPQQHQQ